jgi:hypothetical protein
MNVGRLFWRTPTGAMLWEIWGRNKANFLWQAAALAAGFFFVGCNEHGASRDASANWAAAAFSCFLLAYLHLLVCCGYFEVDARTMQLSYPRRLLFKPVSTARLALMPMFFGGIITLSSFLIWTELVLRHWVNFTPSGLIWISAVQLSFFWWIQALAWSFPFPMGRLFVLIVMGIIHFLVWHMAQTRADAWSGWHWPILFALLLSALSVAWLGLKLMRRGKWESPSRISLFWTRWTYTAAQGRRQQFRSALAAQFWLEWRRQGLLLPAVSGGVACLFIAVAFLFRKISGTAGQSGDPEMAASLITFFVLPTLAVPLILSALLAPLMASFDRFHSTGELPVYIAVRPMSNGGLVLAKLAMALATSALTCFVTAAACLCLVLPEKGILFSKAGLVTPFGPVGFMTGCVPVLLLLVIWTWKNLVAGIGAGLTGRTWISVAFSLGTLYVVNFGPFLLVDTARTNVNFREVLLHWLTTILIACLAAKITLSITAFVLGVRRNAITARAVGWMAGGWLVCGLFVAGFAGHVCNEIHKPDVWIWAGLGGFLILPLADLAIAPLALAWNRHR